MTAGLPDPGRRAKTLAHPQRLVAYLLAVVAVTLIHSPAWLMGGLTVAMLASGPGRLTLLKRALLPVLFVVIVISSGYLAMGLLSGEMITAPLVLINVRVALLALLTAWMARDVDLQKALARFPSLQRLLAIVRVQLGLFSRLGDDYREAFASRSTVPPTFISRYAHSCACGLAALDKAVHYADAVTQGMRSRGALDD